MSSFHRLGPSIPVIGAPKFLRGFASGSQRVLPRVLQDTRVRSRGIRMSNVAHDFRVFPAGCFSRNSYSRREGLVGSFETGTASKSAVHLHSPLPLRFSLSLSSSRVANLSWKFFGRWSVSEVPFTIGRDPRGAWITRATDPNVMFPRWMIAKRPIVGDGCYPRSTWPKDTSRRRINRSEGPGGRVLARARDHGRLSSRKKSVTKYRYISIG